MTEAGDDPDVIILNLPPWSALEINALQRASNIVIQKSLKEGFGLTVTEALWKRKPVIAGAVGGIPTQVIHKLTGMLVHSVEGCAYQIRYLLTHPDFAAQLGRHGHEHSKENFLLTSNIKRWLINTFELRMRRAESHAGVFNLARAEFAAVLGLEPHSRVEIWQVIRQPRSPNRRRIKGIKAEEEDSRFTLVGHVRSHIQFRESREHRQRRHAPKGNIGHVKRRHRHPCFAVVQIQR